MKHGYYITLRFIFTCFFLGIIYMFCSGQSFQPLYFEGYINIASQINKDSARIHTGTKPFRYNISDGFCNKFSYKTLIHNDIICYTDSLLDIKVNPLFNFQFTQSQSDSALFKINSRGVEIKGEIGKKISFYTSFYENQAYFPVYLTDYIDDKLVVPGQGAWKEFSENGRDYSSVEGYISYYAHKLLQVSIGTGKHFIGHGYRSLLLSDFAFNYPYLRLASEFGDFRYEILYTEFLDFKGAYYNYHYKKHGNFLYLSYLPKHWLEIGLFEGSIWQTGNEIRSKQFTADYFLPVPGLRSAWNNNSGDNNFLFGVNIRANFAKQFQLYGQLLLDGIDKKKFASGFQAGLTCYDAFFSKLPHHKFTLVNEFNFVQPYAYQHKNLRQNYSHYNEPLAHPSGAGLNEYICIANYWYKRFGISAKLISRVQKCDSTSYNTGADIFHLYNASSSNENISSGDLNQHTIYKSIFCRFLVNPKFNLQVKAGIEQRQLILHGDKHQGNFYIFAISTTIRNRYYNFL